MGGRESGRKGEGEAGRIGGSKMGRSENGKNELGNETWYKLPPVNTFKDFFYNSPKKLFKETC